MIAIQKKSTKSPIIIILTIVSWSGMAIISGYLFYRAIPDSYPRLFVFFLRGFHIPWMIFWLWGIHNFWHQTLSFFPRKRVQIPSKLLYEDPVVILYTTCDDFDETACLSCLYQDYPNFRVIICDDSREEGNRMRVNSWVKSHSDCVTVVRRHTHRGFKAGNLNHVIRNHVREDYIVICDADSVLPRDFIQKMLSVFHAHRDDSIGFIQARNRSRENSETLFARLLGPGIDILYQHTLPLRNRFGFVSCFGHGVMIRRNVWETMGGCPEIVSEDLAFASRALVYGYRGVYVESIHARESFPPTYTAFVAKYKKIIGGTIEYFQEECLSLLKSRKASLIEKVDLIFTFSYCFIGLISMINIFSGLFLSYIFKIHGYQHLQTWLLCIYLIGPLTPILPFFSNVFRKPNIYCPYFIIGAISYVSLLPILAVKSISQLFRMTRTIFQATGRVGREGQSLKQHAHLFFLGTLIIILATVFPSPVFPPVMNLSLMFILAPLLIYIERNDILGTIARYGGFFSFLLMFYLLTRL